MDDNALDQNKIDAEHGHDLSSFDSTQRYPVVSVTESTAVPVSSASVSPLSSLPSLPLASPPLLSSPTTTSPPIELPEERSLWTRRRPTQSGSETTAQCTDPHYDADLDSAFAGEAYAPLDPRYTFSNQALISSPAADRPSGLLPSSTEMSICETSDKDLTRTSKRLRSNSGQAVKIRQEQTAETQISTPKTRRGTEKRASKLSPVLDHLSYEPLDALIKQIGQTYMIVDIQESVRQLKATSHQVRNLTGELQNRTPIYSDTSVAQIIDVTPILAREIEHSTFYEQLSRIYHRMALAEFYCAYRAAHANPYVFLQELDRQPSQQTHQSGTRNRTKRAEVKERFIQLVFCQSASERDYRKDSTRVNNWQKAGRPWFELIDRFGTGILLLIPEGVTNCRQVLNPKPSPFGQHHIYRPSG